MLLPGILMKRVDSNLSILDISILGNIWAMSNLLRDLVISILTLQLIRHLSEKGIEIDIVWLSHPTQAGALALLPPRYIYCYDCMDDYLHPAFSAKQDSAKQDYYRKNEQKILSRSDIVFATSASLERKCAASARKVIRVPNGVDVEHFLRESPNELVGWSDKKKCIGFFGAIGPWIDFDLLSHIARAHPEWIIRFIGPCDYPVLRSRLLIEKNIELIGEIPYEKLPLEANKFDVCIIPFKTGPFGDSINPVKMYEYLATGKPVVSTSLAEARDMAPAIRIATDYADFSRQIEHSLAHDDALSRESRLKLARDNSWDRRMIVIKQSINQMIDDA